MHILLGNLWRTKSLCGFPLDHERGAVIVANHRSSIDPFLIHLIAGQLVSWMVAREFCESWLFGWFLRQARTIPTRRGGIDNTSIMEAVRLLKEGKWVGVLPEGRINMSDEFMLPVRPGAALLARKANVPIVPVYIDGAPYNKTVTSPFFMRANVTISIGQPIHPEDFESDQDLILAAVQAIARLANRPDFQPALAGRNWKPKSGEEANTQAEQSES